VELKRLAALCGALVAAFATGLLAQAPAEGDAKLPEGQGKELVESICSFCHPPTYPLHKRLTEPQWQRLVIGMLQEEEVTQAEKDSIVAYLAKALPKRVNVNKGSAEELVLVLEVTPAQAAAMVAWRAGNGGFKGLEDLKKVLGEGKVDGMKGWVEF
jgi:DNA uptake protein ComE-like DNA-binding protein